METQELKGLGENKNEPCAMTVDRACVMIEESQHVNVTRTDPNQQGTHVQLPGSISQQTGAQLQSSSMASVAPVHWLRRPRGRLKCNVDAGFSVATNRTSISICVRDDDGAFVLAKTISFDVVHSVHVGEALGLYHALEWLSDMQFDIVDFETDCKTTCDAFHSHKDDVSEFGHIISACQSLFTNHFTNSRVEFIRR
jgi:ribonuclease HI